MREVDLDVCEPCRLGSVRAEQPAHLRTPGAHLGAELHEGRARAEGCARRIRRLEPQVAAVASTTLTPTKRETDEGGECEKRGHGGEGECGGHTSSVRPEDQGCRDVSIRDENIAPMTPPSGRPRRVS